MSAKYNSKTRARTCIPSKKLVRRYMRMNTKKNKNRKALKNSETYKIKIDKHQKSSSRTPFIINNKTLQ